MLENAERFFDDTNGDTNKSLEIPSTDPALLTATSAFLELGFSF
jgi:hypothetical protein